MSIPIEPNGSIQREAHSDVHDEESRLPAEELDFEQSDTRTAGAHIDDEEAQLLPTEELDFEENISYPSRRTRLWRIYYFLQGPHPPRPQTINTWVPWFQKQSAQFAKSRYIAAILSTMTLLWLLVYFFILVTSQLPIPDNEGGHVVNLDCVDTLWRHKNECGLDGIDCRPFTNDSFAFRCPANCASVKVLNPHPVGPLDVNYQPLVIGSQIYRGDSFICASALHADIVDNTNGGCGRLTRVGDHVNFVGSEEHGIESIPFDSYFPLSFTVNKDASLHCKNDPRLQLFLLSFLFTICLSIYMTSPLLFFPIFTTIFLHVSLVSDPPTASYHNISVLPDHISMFAKRLLPALFCAVVVYRTTVQRTLRALEAQFEKTVLWTCGFWIGALSNYTFDWIPISRLTSHDLAQQPGAKIALAVILLLLASIIAGQVYYFWVEGRLLSHLGLYGLFIFGILVCLVIPGVQLRIHHYILALLLLPGTTIKTRPSLLYQGILLGLFVNGIARWDFDSILQTSDALRADGALDSALPSLMQPVMERGRETLEVMFSWDVPPVGMQGISVLVNDVERDRAFFGDEDEAVEGFIWRRDVGLEVNEYFRFAFVRGGVTLDYTDAGTLFGNGSWVYAGT